MVAGRHGPMMKRRRGNTSVALETSVAWTLPTDLMLEIVARTEPCTLFRCAAASKLLRREIVNPSFIRRVSHRAAPCILAYLCSYGSKPLTLIHPSTTVATSFCQDQLWRYMSHKFSILLDKFRFETSRRGLVLLLRRSIKKPKRSNCCRDMCVYDPMSSSCTFLSYPPDINITESSYNRYVLLTATDGIDGPFLLIVAEIYACSIKVQTTSSCGIWGPVTYVRDEKFWWCFLKVSCDPAVLRGGLIHWLASYCEKKILTYDLGTGKPSSMKLPSTNNELDQFHLVTSSDGKVLRLLSIEGFKISMWLHLPVSQRDGNGWSLQSVVDIEEKIRSLDPNITGVPKEIIVFRGSGQRTGNVVLLEVHRQSYSDALFVFDMDTKEMHRQKREYSLLEIDLPSRLEAMKIFL